MSENTNEKLRQIIITECAKEGLDFNNEEINKIIDVAIREVEKFSKTLWDFYEDISSRSNSITIIPQDIFLSVIKHFRSIVNQKIEHKGVGVKLIITTHNKKFDLEGKYPIQLKIQRETKNRKEKRERIDKLLDENIKIYKCVDSQNAVFVYYYDTIQDNIKFCGIKYSNKDMLQLCENTEIGFEIPINNTFIRIYNSHKRIVDYFLSEKTGDWFGRFEGEINKVLKFVLGQTVFSDEVDLLTNTIMLLSFKRIGSIFVITEKKKKFFKSETPCEVQSETLHKLYFNNLIDVYASYDGAVILTKENKQLVVNKFGVMLNPKKKPNEIYNEKLIKTNCGARHEKSVRYAIENPNDVVIVLSENRTISIIHGEDPIYWKDELIKQEISIKE